MKNISPTKDSHDSSIFNGLVKSNYPAFNIILFIAGVLFIYGIYNVVLVTTLKVPTDTFEVLYDNNMKGFLKVHHQGKPQIDTITISTKLEAVIKNKKRMIFLNEHPKFLFWLFGVSLMNAVSIVLIWPIIQNIRYGYLLLNLKVQRKIRVLIGVGGFLSLLFFILVKTYAKSYIATIPMLMAQFNILYAEKNQWIMTYFVSIAPEFTGGLGIIGISILVLLVGGLQWDSTDEQEKSAKELVKLGEQFKLYVYLISGLILMGSINIGLMREIMLSFLGADFNIFFPSDLVWAYGITFSIVLGVVYFPAFYYFEDQGKQIPSETGISSTNQTGQPWNTVKIIMAALAPLLGTVVQELINTVIGKF